MLGGEPVQAQPTSELPTAKPVPLMQVIPLPDYQSSFQREDRELTRLHFAPSQERPFLFPVIGPSGRSLTRMGHPRDPQGHSHHNSVWIALDAVDGESFWADRGPGRILQRRVVGYEDAADHAAMVTENHWIGAEKRVHLVEKRRVAVQPLPRHEWLMIIDLEFRPGPGLSQVTLGPTAFGPIGVRMAKTIGVADGGGMIRNSQGQVNENGDNGAFRKPARWVDYSGPITSTDVEGITLFDHPANPHHPTPFHLREDGWMGASNFFEHAATIEKGQVLRLRYGLYVHSGLPSLFELERRFASYAAMPRVELPEK